MTQFTISITRHIVQCGAKIAGSVEIAPVVSVALDDDQRYVLGSSGRWSTSDITSTLATNGVSMALNAQSADQTAVVISNVIGTAAQVAIGAAVAIPVRADTQLCQPDVAAAVNELYPPKDSQLKPLKDQVDQATGVLAVATAKVALLTAQVQLDRSLRPTLVQALSEQDKQRIALEGLQTRLTAKLAATTDVQVVSWPSRGNEFRTVNPYLIPADVLSKWLTDKADRDDANRQFSVFAALYRRDETGAWTPAEAQVPAPIDVSIGVPVRIPRVGRLLVCAQQPCPDASLPAGPNRDTRYTANDLPVLQLGQVYVVPVTGGSFKSETAIIALDASGAPTSIEVAEKASTAAAISAAAKDAATQLSALPAQISAAQLAQTQARTNQLTANASLAAAEANASIQGQLGTLSAQTSLITAQTNLANAQANAGLPTNQTNALTAQTALLNAQAALVNAQATAPNINQTSAWAAQASLANAQAAQISAAAALAKAQAGGGQ